jgi:ATP-dependent DNA helicase DinG
VSGEAAAASSPDVGSARLAQARRVVAAAFSGDGELASAVAGFSPRDSQREMALAVFDTIAERGTLIAEAGTGTGKTFAYLVPALLAGGKVLVSTGTRTLQDQVFAKDVATLVKALGLRVDAALLKGRQNYVCLLRLARTEAEGRLPSREDAAHLRSIVRFAGVSSTGDRAELADVPEAAAIWPLVTSTRENCIGQECPRLGECFVYRARRAAQAADVVVVNHHLFLADLALRDDSIRDFLPAVDTVVLDEAHQLPRTAADFFGTGWSLAQLADLAHDARALGLASAAGGAPWVPLTQAIEAASRNLRLLLAEGGLRAGMRQALDRCEARTTLRRGISGIDEALGALAGAVKANAGRDAEFDALAPRVAVLRGEIAAWIAALDEQGGPRDGQSGAVAAEDRLEADPRVRWIAVTAHGAQFHATPLAPGAALARAREQQAQAWILVSATLTLAGSFAPFLADIGLRQARTERWESPFDFPRQALLYLPRPLPSPLQGDCPERVADASWPVIAAAGGRAFVLCSTLRAVERVAARLAEAMARDRLALPLLVQGSSTRRALLDEFRRHGNAVLVGSVSFWEGIDVRGEALSLVVIDKLPFAPPDDPVVEARIRRLKAMGRNPFLEYQLPEAVTLLKQGVGRLIRDERDRGVLMILDERLLAKPYGRTVLASLPPFARTREESVACGFFSAPVPSSGS